MLAIFFDLTSFFDLQEWVLGDYKKKEKTRTKSASTWDREIEKNSIVWKVEKGKKRKEKRKTRYSTVWNLSTIKILGSNSLGTLVHWSRVLFKTQFCEAWVLKM